MNASAKKSRRRMAVSVVAVSWLLLAGCAGHARQQGAYAEGVDPGQGPMTIGSDKSAESRVVAAMYDRLLVAAGKQARIVSTLYDTPSSAAEAVVNGDLALAPAYENSVLRTFPAGQRLVGNMAATLSMALPVGIDALSPAAADRGVVFAVDGPTARRYALHTVADLAKIQGGVTIGGSASDDPDVPSAAALAKAYGVRIAPNPGAVVVLALGSTDPAIAAQRLTVLSDPAGVIPPENVLPLINAEYADKATRVALARLNSVLTTDQLAGLARAVAEGENPDSVASAWLRAHGLVR
jgi:osmoprotectant transport system substrate-binding protein